MQRIKAVVEFDGSGYCGWQYQENDKTIQGEIERALQVVFKDRIGITGAGRTDAGVHARNQVFHADIPDYSLYKLKNSLNGLLNADIVIKQIERCSDNFHARFDAEKRRYRYYVSEIPTALARSFSWHIVFPVNITLLQAGASLICAYNDFKSFCKSGSDVNNYHCQIFDSRWIKQNGLMIYEICANRFLYGMVRAVVGTLIDLGRGKITLSEMNEIILSRDRTKVLNSAPAKGLVLEEIYYT